MKRVAIIGSGGAGKTTLARALGERTGLPVIHLDRLYWNTGWVETPHDEWLKRQNSLLAQERWIVDGNYGSTMDVRLAAADTVIFLDLPRLRCLWRVFKRRLRYHNRSRPDMNEDCPERLTWEFLRFVWTYPKTRRPVILEKLGRLGDKRVIRLWSVLEVEAFLARLSERVAT